MRPGEFVSRASGHSITFDQRAYVGTGRDVAVEAKITNVFFRTRGGQVIGMNDEVFDSWGELRNLSEPPSCADRDRKNGCT